MDRRFSFLIVAVSLFCQMASAQTPPANPTPSDQKTDVTYICQRLKDMRWIRSYMVDANRCRSLYSKEGFVQTVSSAQNFNSCKIVIDNIKANIEEGGFKCKEAQLISMVELE